MFFATFAHAFEATRPIVSPVAGMCRRSGCACGGGARGAALGRQHLREGFTQIVLWYVAVALEKDCIQFVWSAAQAMYFVGADECWIDANLHCNARHFCQQRNDASECVGFTRADVVGLPCFAPLQELQVGAANKRYVIEFTRDVEVAELYGRGFCYVVAYQLRNKKVVCLPYARIVEGSHNDNG